MKTNQKGFTAIEIVLILVIVGVLSFAGWYVYNSQKKTNDTLNKTAQGQGEAQKATTKATLTQPKDETANWLLFTSKQKTYSFKVPDGWKLTHQTDSDLAYATGQDLAYKAGTKATVVETSGGRDGIYGFSISFDDNEVTSTRKFTDFKNEGTFVTNTGLSGTKYSITFTDESQGIGPPKGSVEYAYYFVKDGKAMYVDYIQVPGAPDSLAVAEKAIKTAQLL